MAGKVEDDDVYAWGGGSGAPRVETVSTTTSAGEKTHKLKVVPVNGADASIGAGVPVEGIYSADILSELRLIRTCLQHMSGLDNIELGESLED